MENTQEWSHLQCQTPRVTTTIPSALRTLPVCPDVGILEVPIRTRDILTLPPRALDGHRRVLIRAFSMVRLLRPDILPMLRPIAPIVLKDTSLDMHHIPCTAVRRGWATLHLQVTVPPHPRALMDQAHYHMTLVPTARRLTLLTSRWMAH